MTAKEKEFLDRLMAFGLDLMEEVKENSMMDEERFLTITIHPKLGWVNVDFVKDGIRKDASRLDKYPVTDYEEHESYAR